MQILAISPILIGIHSDIFNTFPSKIKELQISTNLGLGFGLLGQPQIETLEFVALLANPGSRATPNINPIISWPYLQIIYTLHVNRFQLLSVELFLNLTSKRLEYFQVKSPKISQVIYLVQRNRGN